MTQYIAPKDYPDAREAAAGGRPVITTRQVFKPDSKWSFLSFFPASMVGIGTYHLIIGDSRLAYGDYTVAAIALLLFLLIQKLTPIQRRRLRQFDRMVADRQIVAVPDVIEDALRHSSYHFKVHIDIQSTLQNNAADVLYLSETVVPMLTDPGDSAETRRRAREEITNCTDGICFRIRESTKLLEEDARREVELNNYGQRRMLGVYPPVAPPSNDRE